LRAAACVVDEESAPVDQNLLGILRDRMGAKSDAELLHVWVENNRLQWSPECFEAIRLILEQRHVTLPPQNEPPQRVLSGSPLDDDPWVRLLGGLLWVGVALGGFGMLYGASRVLFSKVDEIDTVTILDLSKSTLLTVGAIGALGPRRRLVFRWIAMTYAWTAIALWVLGGLGITLGAYRLARVLDGAAVLHVYRPTLMPFLVRLVYPAVLLWLLYRPTVRERYHGPARIESAFEPVLPAQPTRADG
jgi:hypothetical protein